MKTHKWKDIRRKNLSDGEIAAIETEIALELSLQELRAMVGVTQEKLAAELEIAQASLSKIEASEDHKLSTVRRYVEALGGELEVVAVVGNKRLKLVGV